MNGVIPAVVDCMTPGPHVIAPNDTLLEAEAVMLEHEIRHLPVMTVEGEIVGILSDRDIARALALTHEPAHDIAVEDAMTPDPYTVGPLTPLNVVARMMAERKVGSAIVRDRGTVIGVVTTTDALHGLADTLEGKQPRHFYEFVATVPNSRGRSHESDLR